MRPLELVGQTFGHLTVKSRAENSPRGRTQWLCVCTCGREVVVMGGNLARGLSGSCGCQRNYKHGASHDPTTLYKTWVSMKQRTGNPKNPSYVNYGGRGIKMLLAWQSDYSVFERDILETLGPRPEGMTLDRIDNDGDYRPDNLRWATKEQQSWNRRAKRKLCSFPECDRMGSVRGLCQSHARQHAKGEDLRPLRGRHKRP